MGLCFCGSVGISSHWFEKKRSLVNGIAAAGSGVGGLIYSLAVGKMIPELGLSWSMRVLGIIVFVVNITCANLLRVPTRPTSSSDSTLPFALFKRLDFGILLAWGFLSALGYVTLLFSLPSYSVAIGLTQEQGSLASALLNLGQSFGRPAVGFLSDHFGRIHVSLVASFLAGLLPLVLWIFADSAGLTYFFAVVVGLFAGTFLASAAPLAAEVVGIQQLGAALGIIWFVLTPPTAVAEAIALQLRDETALSKPYLKVQLFAGFMYIGSAICLGWLLVEVRRKKKVVSVEKA